MTSISKKEVKELTLLLAFLNSWDENSHRKYGENPVMRSWINFDFDILNELQESGMIYQSNSAKSLYFTEEGISKAKHLLSKYFQHLMAG